MKCSWCGGDLSRVVPAVAVGKAIHDYVPHLMLVKCFRGCDRNLLVEREEPHRLGGTVTYRDKGNGMLRFTLFAAEGELIVVDEEAEE